jgi:hypothetical protein
MAHENKTKKMERCTNRVRVQQNFIMELQVSKQNLCEKMFIQKCCSAWSAHCKNGDEHEMWEKEKATGTVYKPGRVKETVQ